MPVCPPFEEVWEEEEENDWDEASRRANEGNVPQDAKSSRSLCSNCGRPLHRYAKLPVYQTLLMCSRSKECSRCEETIEPGDMHFVCASCLDRVVCKDCGPGVIIQREYDYVDAAGGDVKVDQLPSRVIHERRKTRSVELEDDAGTSVAQKVFQKVLELSKQVSEEEDVSHKEWDTENLLPDLLGETNPAAMANSMLALVKRVTAILKAQPTLTEVKAPCKIFGDLHGQCRDLLLLMHSFGVPGTPDCPHAVFNGDFVDRGKQQLETVTILFALKVLFPTQIFLNRGNHEDTTMNHKYGFEAAAMSPFGPELGLHVYDAFATAFTYLPLATLIGGKVLALHGGIGDGKWALDDVRRAQRPLTHENLQEPDNRILWNILWSDPIEDDTSGQSVFGVHNSPRSKMAFKFGWNVTQAFCARNALDLVVRSHQSKKGGLGFDVMHNEKLVRVFSARDYEGNDNDGAVLQVQEEEDGCLSVRSQVLRSITWNEED